MRGISTVADTTVFLLLVSASVLVVTVPAEEAEPIPADRTAEILTTSTASVEYSLSDGAGKERTVYGTFSGLLARAAVANATLDGTPVSPANREYVNRVRNRTAATLGTRTQVTARWTLYEESPLAGTVSVGPDPPVTADVHVATVQVPVSVPAPESQTADGYRAIADELARAATGGLLPRGNGVFPQGSSPLRRAIRHRYRVLAGEGTERALARLAASNVSGATAVTTRALGRRLRRDLRETFATPAAAREAIRSGVATITVRRWDE